VPEKAKRQVAPGSKFGGNDVGQLAYVVDRRLRAPVLASRVLDGEDVDVRAEPL
jgi:hypothetical protein